MVKKIDHIAIAVRNLDEWLELFNRFFGLQPPVTERRAGQGVKVAFLPVGEVSIEFMQPTEPGSALSRFLEIRGEGVHHICLEVEDIEGEIKALEGKGAQFASQETRPDGSMKLAFLHPKSTKGLLLQIGQKLR